MLRPFSDVPYIPFLSLRPAEMLALEELPDKTKDRMLPLVHLRPWTTAFALQSGLDRLAAAYGSRPMIVAVGSAEASLTPRPVHSELANLRLSGQGYKNWCDFISGEGHENFIPAIQIEDVRQIDKQVAMFYRLGRGLVVIVPKFALGGLSVLVRIVARETAGGEGVCFILDEERMARDSLARAAVLVGYCSSILSECPYATISISGSSFPSEFRDRTQQDIFERILFDEVSDKVGFERMVFSDRGSARVERQKGGGVPKPRIDYPLGGQWMFFRSEDEGKQEYQRLAKELMTNPTVFDPDLRIWGTLMIERTGAGIEPLIVSAARATAVRINLHLQRQTFAKDPIGLYDTEDDW